MASFYSDALLYRKPLSTHSTTLSFPKIRLPRRSKRRFPVVRLGSKNPRRGGRFSLSRILRRVKLRWLRLQYSCMLKRLKQYYKSLIKDIISEGTTSIEAYHKQRVLMESSMGMHPLALGASNFSHFHSGSSNLCAPKSVLEQAM